jgi:hypothetical protein
MLYEFKSKATGTVVMTGPVAERMLAIIGKDPAARGIITVEQLGPAIEALQQAVARERAEGMARGAAESTTRGTVDHRQGAHDDPANDVGEDDRDDPRRSVSLAQRAFPLIEMFTAARAADRDVTWGV